MDPIYLQNITEIRNEYTTFLTNILTPFIYEGIKSTYTYAVNAHNEFIEKGKHDPSIKSPGILKLFQLTLKEIPTLNNNSIDIETTRIKSQCKCADWFDDLVRAVIKSNIILLTFSNPKKRPEIIKEEFHNKVDIRDFIHKCYIESARSIYNNPELFWHEYPTLEIKRNQRESCELIRKSVSEAIRRILPIKLILREYLQNNFEDNDNDITKPMSEGNYMKIQSMINRDLHGLHIPQRNESVLEDDKEEDLMKHDDDDDKYIKHMEENISHLEEKQQSGGRDGDSDDDEDEDEPEVQEDYLETSDSDDSDNDNDSDPDNFLNEVRRKLEKVEEKIVKKPESKEETKDQTKDKTKESPNKVEKIPDKSSEKSETKIEKKPITETGVNTIPKGENDTEKLIENSNAVLNIENPKKRLNKKEQEFYNQISSKDNKNDAEKRKTYFEQYMK